MYRIADIPVFMEPRFELSRGRSERYRTDDTVAAMTVVGDGNEIEEYARLAVSFYEQLLRFDGFLLHSSAVELDSKAYLFSAPSGTGKSTHASFWKTELGATVINDDKPAIRLIDGVFCACGTPFSGKTDQSRNVCVPIGGIAFLTRAPQTDVARASAKEALWALLNQTVRPSDAPTYLKLLSLIEEMLKTVPVYHLGCENDPSAAAIAYNGMKMV